MFDATLTQYVNRFDDQSIGGMAGCMQKMTQADPDFVLGQALMVGIGNQVSKDAKFAQQVYKMAELAEKPHVKPWERHHACAFRLLAEGHVDAAVRHWEDILVDHPRDMMAVSFMNAAYLFHGESKRILNKSAAIAKYWTPSTPFYSDFLSYYAFGLMENNFYKQSEDMSKKALEINPNDGWACHTMSHIYEMTGRYEDGIKFMTDTANNWADTGIGCHNYWHLALHYYEKGDFEGSVGILDKQVIPKFKKASKGNLTVPLTDAASLIFRLEAEGVNVTSRWSEIIEKAESHTDDHYWSMGDLHVLMTCLGAGKDDIARDMMKGVREYSRNGTGDIKKLYDDITIPLMEAIEAYNAGQYDTTVDIMKRIRYKVQQVGGSHAQRDVFDLLTIYAALRSALPENQRYANQLLLERKSFKECESPLIERLTQKLVISH